MSAIDISNLSNEDKLVLLDEMWVEMEMEPSPLQLSNEQRLELDRRLDAMDKEGPIGLTWEEVLTQHDSQGFTQIVLQVQTTQQMR